MNKVLQITLWLVVITGVVIALGFVNKSSEKQTFLTPLIYIDYETENRFVDEQDILNQVVNLEDSIHLLTRFNVNELEEKLSNNSSIKDVQVYKTIDGNLKIDVKQRRPIVRIFSKNNDSYYIDENGDLMLWTNKYTSRLPVMNGNINEPYNKRYKLNYHLLPDSVTEKTILDDVYQIAKYIDQSEFWSAQIEQIYVNKVSDFELVPKVGNHKIVFGGADNLESKFEKLMVFYQKGLSKTGWNEYSEINLKYKNQVVCTKRFN